MEFPARFARLRRGRAGKRKERGKKSAVRWGEVAAREEGGYPLALAGKGARRGREGGEKGAKSCCLPSVLIDPPRKEKSRDG
jgi:hypothetical protein